MLTHKELRDRALERADVKSEYDRFDEEFSLKHSTGRIKKLRAG